MRLEHINWESAFYLNPNTTMGYLHPETSQIKVVIDRLNQQKYLM